MGWIWFNPFLLAETRYIKIPLRSYFIRINGKKLIDFGENRDLHKQFIFYDAKPKEVIYLRNNHSVAIFCKINNTIYHLKGIEYEIAYTELWYTIFNNTNNFNEHFFYILHIGQIFLF